MVYRCLFIYLANLFTPVLFVSRITEVTEICREGTLLWHIVLTPGKHNGKIPVVLAEVFAL